MLPALTPLSITPDSERLPDACLMPACQNKNNATTTVRIMEMLMSLMPSVKGRRKRRKRKKIYNSLRHNNVEQLTESQINYFSTEIPTPSPEQAPSTHQIQTSIHHNSSINNRFGCKRRKGSFVQYYSILFYLL